MIKGSRKKDIVPKLEEIQILNTSCSNSNIPVVIPSTSFIGQILIKTIPYPLNQNNQFIIILYQDNLFDFIFCLFILEHGMSHGHSHGISISHNRLSTLVCDDPNENDEAYRSSLPPSPPQIKRSHGHSHDASQMNMRGVFLHVLSDALGSVIVIISAAIITWTDWEYK